jgi:dTDP-4-amino-4,6-dideoxygalactose transaminase
MNSKTDNKKTLEKEYIWLSSPHMSGYEIKYVISSIEKNQVFPLGENVYEFEKAIKNYSGSACCSCLVTGTAAIHLALILLNVRSGDEVICSTFTFAASVNPICYQNATPIFVDSEEKTWNMDPVLLHEAIKDRLKKTGKKPKAIIVVHLYGMPADMDSIMKVANEYDIPVIEDAAEALGSKYDDKHCGTMGIMGIYSFNGNKIITTSGGGALISNNEEYCKKATYYATQARQNAPHYQHEDIGYNYRMSNISAGIGLGQMEVLRDRVNSRRKNNILYKELLRDIDGITFQEEPEKKYYSNYWLTTVVINSKKLDGMDRELIRKGLLKKYIETRPLWKPMHLQPIFNIFPSYQNKISENLFTDGLCLPSSSLLYETKIEYIVNQFKKIIRRK